MNNTLTVCVGGICRLGEFGSQRSFHIAEPCRHSRAAFDAAHAAIASGVAQWGRRINLVSKGPIV